VLATTGRLEPVRRHNGFLLAQSVRLAGGNRSVAGKFGRDDGGLP